MQVSDIYTFINVHIEKHRNNAYREMHIWLQTPEGIRELESNNITDKANLSSFLNQKYLEYINVIKLGIDCTLDLFTQHGIQYRLYDVHSFTDTPGVILLSWDVDNRQYDFVITGLANHGPYYKLGITDGQHVLKGSSTQEFEFDKPLPEWFVKGLKIGYC